MEFEGVLPHSDENVNGSHTKAHIASLHPHTPTICKPEVSGLAVWCTIQT